jgi:hypothetical protein
MKLLQGGATLGTILYVLGLPLILGCGGATNTPTEGSGGGGGSSGATAMGGAAGSGGVTVTGGAAGSGGVTSAGGAAGSGGVTSAGGAAGSGGTAGAGGVSVTGGAGGAAGGDSSCKVFSDCAWGEIGHEIIKRTDCMCLFGCPGLIQNVTTVARRRAQYTAICDPAVDGQGRPCPIDDCMMPPPLACVGGQCAVASAEAGAGGAGGAGAVDGGSGHCGRTGDAPCPANRFCEIPVGCVAGNAGGTCLVKPSMCNMMYAPVCGCDKMTYGNDCTRQGAGQPKLADGECT